LDLEAEAGGVRLLARKLRQCHESHTLVAILLEHVMSFDERRRPVRLPATSSPRSAISSQEVSPFATGTQRSA
jgi:hypothetical protein